MAASPRKRLILTLVVALALTLGFASWRGWLPGVADWSEMEGKAPR